MSLIHKLLGSGEDGDLAGMADRFQQTFSQQGFDPLSLFAGEARFHSLFLAPMAPGLKQAVAEFLEHGTGPLTALIEQAKAAGVPEAEAPARVRMVFERSSGMCVAVFSDDQGLSSFAHIFFGHLDEGYGEQICRACAEHVANRDAVRRALDDLRAAGDRGRTWPELFASADQQSSALVYWTGIAESLVRAADQGLAGPRSLDRVGQLPHYVADAIARREEEHKLQLNVRTLMALARCHAFAGEIVAAVKRAGQAVTLGGGEDEAVVKLVEHLVGAAIAAGEPQEMVGFFQAQDAALDAAFGRCYELARPRFAVMVAAMVPAEDLLAAADRLKAADRKAFRHDLNREPLWRIAVKDPGELLDTTAAAERIGRSSQFVAKRLENGTIPFFRKDEEVRIPALALDAWKAVMDRFQLLE